MAGQNSRDYLWTQRLHMLESDDTDPMGPYHFKAGLESGVWELDPNIITVGGRLYLLGGVLATVPLASRTEHRGVGAGDRENRLLARLPILFYAILTAFPIAVEDCAVDA